MLSHGLPHLGEWAATPIDALAAEEKVRIRAQRGETLSSEQAPLPPPIGAPVAPTQATAARHDALEARTNEAIMVKSARANVLGMMSAGLALVRPAQKIAMAIMRAVEAGIDGANGVAKDPMASLIILREVAKTLRSVIESGHKAMEMERLILGDPAAGGQTSSDADSMTDEDMLIELSNAAKVYSSLERKGLRLVQGGRGVTSEPLASTGTDAAIAAREGPPDPREI